MSEDFDKNDDDLSWLDDEDNDPDENDNTADEDFDWAAEDDEGPAGDQQAPGFTSELSWRQDDGDEAADFADDDGDSFDWQSADGEDAPGDTSALGFTGMLSWRQDDNEDGDDLSGGSTPFDLDDDALDEGDDLSFLAGLETDSADDLDDGQAFADDEQTPPDDDLGFDEEPASRPGEIEPEGDPFATRQIDVDDDDDDFAFLAGIEDTQVPDDDDFDFGEEDPVVRPGEIEVEDDPYTTQQIEFDDDDDEQIDFGFLAVTDDDDDDGDFDFGEEDPDDIEDIDPTQLDTRSLDFLRGLVEDGEEADDYSQDDYEAEPQSLDTRDLGFMQDIDRDGSPTGDEDIDFLAGLSMGADKAEEFGFTDGMVEDEDPIEDDDDFDFLDDIDQDEFDEMDFELDPNSSTPDADAFLASLLDGQADQADPIDTSDLMPDDDLFAGLVEEDEDESPADFEEVFALAEDGPDFGEVPLDEDDEAALLGGDEFSDDFDAELDDFGADELDTADFDDENADMAVPAYQNLDDLLAGYEDDETVLPASDELEDGAAFFDDESDLLPADGEADDSLPARPDFLQDVSVGDEQSSAAAYVRQMENRPEDELDEKLYQLHQRGLGIQRRADEDPDIQQILPGVSDTLAEPDMRYEQESLSGEVEMSADDERGADLLRNLVAGDAMTQRRPAPTDPDDPLGDLDEFRDLDEAASHPERPAPRARSRFPIGRLLVAVLLLAAVIAPFFIDFNIGGEGTLPGAFDTGGEEAAVFELLGTLSPLDYVLFSVDYGPANAAELDPLFEMTVKHTLAQGAFPVFVGQNAVGVSRVEDLMANIAADEAFVEAVGGVVPTYNQDYFVVGFLPGENAALRNLATAPGVELATNTRGELTGLDRFASLDELARIIVLAATPESVRDWSEQVAPQTTTPLLAGVSAVSEDLSRQYLNAPDGLEGLLVSLEDAAIYAQLLEDQVLPGAVNLGSLPTATFTPSATPEISPTPSSTPTLTPIGFEATETPPDFTPSPLPPDFEPYNVFGVGTLVTTNGSALNVREDPSIGGAVVGVLSPQTFVPVLEEVENDDGAPWTQVLLTDGERGWVSTNLLRAADDGEGDPARTRIAQVMQPSATPTAEPTEPPTETATPTATASPAPTATEASTEEPVESMVQEGEEGVESMVQEATDEATEEPTDEPAEVTEEATADEADPDADTLQAGSAVQTSLRTAINVRGGPGTEFERVTTLQPGTLLQVVSTSDDGEWIEVGLPDGQTGFIFRDLLVIVPTDPPTLAPSPTPSEPPTDVPSATPSVTPVPLDADGLVAIVVGQQAVNVRTGPSTSFQALQPLQPGTVLNVVGTSEDENWVQVQLPQGDTGFIIATAVNVIAGETYLQQATATAQAGGQAQVPQAITPGPATATLLPGATRDITENRQPLPLGSTVIPRGQSGVNVRQEPNRFALVLGVAPPNETTPARLLSSDQQWVQVELADGTLGWVSLSVVELTTGESGAGAAREEDSGAAREDAAPTEGAMDYTPRRLMRPRSVYKFAPPQQADTEGFGEIIAGGVANVRGGPGLSFEVVGLTEPGEQVDIITLTDENGGWAEIRLQDGTVGFISQSLIEVGLAPVPADSDTATQAPTEDATEEAEAPDSEGLGVVTANGSVNVRTEPSVQGGVIGVAQPEEELPLLAIVENENGEAWAEVRLLSGREGFISAALLDVLIEPTSESDPATTDEPTEEATAEATDEPTQTPTFTPSPQPTDVTPELVTQGEGVGVISALEPIPIHPEPDANTIPVGFAEPQAEVSVRAVTATESEETWVLIRLEDNTIGYVNSGNMNVLSFPNASLETPPEAIGAPDDSTLEVTDEPTEEATVEATDEPTEEAAAEATDDSTPEATDEPTEEATDEPTEEATPEATDEPTEEATADPTEDTTAEPTEEATAEAVAAVPTRPGVQLGPIGLEPGGFDASLQRRATSARLGLIVAALIIGFGALGNALAARRRK